MPTLQQFAALGQKLDTVLLRKRDDEMPAGSTVGSAVKGAGAIAGGLYAGSAIRRGLAPLVTDRKAGLRATVPGFTQKSGLSQTVAATGSVLKDKPLASAANVGSTIAADARKAVDVFKGTAVGKGYVRARTQGAGLLGALRRGLGSGAAALTRGKVRFSANERVVQLAAKLEEAQA
jgi:hypothetical protein